MIGPTVPVTIERREHGGHEGRGRPVVTITDSAVVYGRIVEVDLDEHTRYSKGGLDATAAAVLPAGTVVNRGDGILAASSVAEVAGPWRVVAVVPVRGHVRAILTREDP